ncbi:efflux transporter outer membrane subunit [Luteimonas viscosa]|uniref:Efflux transporter outer membrane subunit n=1 Tax=Luteimonas viscosa TaxID=1132694 RepID=A0A5D4XPP6_9GAMM|nr:efflux transporter outer membrane subunit [Luteimonas viscosa]TYT26638.1 efflux transporter outer membrane subunit [Luteimonas viscosa]
MVTRLAITTLAAALLAACAVGPDHVRPQVAVPDRFGADDATTGEAAAPSADATAPAGFDDAFLQGLGDEQLAGLVRDALHANHDLRIALTRYDRANALLRGSRLDALPTITAQGEAADVRGSADQAPGVGREARDGEQWSAGISASWELDLFGRVRRGIESGRAEAEASAADLRAMQVAIAGEVARTYVELRGTQERLRVAVANRDNQQQTLDLVQARLDAGAGTEFDMVRARAQLETTAARVPALEAQRQVAMHRLAVLTGRDPTALVATLAPQRALPALPPRIDPGAPGELLRQRPDVAAAEARLHAATARIGVATADLFPRFTLGGLIGSQAIDSSALFERDSETRIVALGIDWSFLDIGRVRARIAAADADAEGELARYQQSVLLALEDAENALVRHGRARTEDAHLERAAIDAEQAAQLARARFEAGASGLFDVLDAERVQLQAQDAFADGRTRSVASAVALYRALAGGWPRVLPERERIAGRR